MTATEFNTLTASFEGLSVKFEENCSMAAHTGFRAGGCARLAVFPRSTGELVDVVALCDSYQGYFPTVILGAGSNTLFCDGSFDGVVIITTQIKKYSFSGVDDDGSVCVYADCGVPLTALAKKASDFVVSDGNALSGLEFAYGIPGTLGGAVAMNAGAYGGEMRDVVLSSVCYNRASGEIVTLTADEHMFDYRNSIFSTNSNLVHLQSKLRLVPASPENIKALMQKNMQARRDKQPLEYPSCGSTFLRPEGRFVGKMTEDCGLKGYTVGGAQLSEKHGGFVINRGGATAADILAVIEHIKDVINREYGVKLECEVKIIAGRSNLSKEIT